MVARPNLVTPLPYETMKTQIKIAYRLLIDAGSTGSFEKKVLRDSYHEFLIQVQSFDQTCQYKTWRELQSQFPKAQLNFTYKTAFAIGLYIKELNHRMPGISDNLGQPVPFETYRFEILDSDTSDFKKHKIALQFQTSLLALNAMLGEYLVLASPHDREEGTSFTIKMQPGMSIVSYRQTEAVSLLP